MDNPLSQLTQKIKKTVVLGAVKQAFEKYPEYNKKQLNIFRNTTILSLAWFGIVFLLGHTLPKENLLAILYTIMVFIAIAGGLVFILRNFNYYVSTNSTYRYFKSINLNNDKSLLDSYPKVSHLLNNYYEDNAFKWQDFNKSLSKEDINIILSTKLTKEQRAYVKSVIYQNKTLTYEDLVQLDNLFMESKEILNVYENNALTNFLKENDLTNINTKDFVDIEKDELKEVELEAEYKRIL